MDISGFGSELALFASTTFPNSILITEFADDADPADSPSIQIRDKAMGLNGRLITWGKAIPVGLTINVIPNSDDDINLDLLFSSNQVALGRRPVFDVIDATMMYAGGSSSTDFNNGATTDYMPANSIASSARLKSKPYVFAFQTKT
jgi:hypothetical protein